MKIAYTYVEGMEPLYIQDGQGVQRVLIVFNDSGNTYCYFCDDYYRTIYINQIIDVSKPLRLDNLKRIDNDEAFNTYRNYLESRYNYNGKYVSEKITGSDRGGATLIDKNGNTLVD